MAQQTDKQHSTITIHNSPTTSLRHGSEQVCTGLSNCDSCKRTRILVLVNRYSGRNRSLRIFQDQVAPFLESQDIDYEVFFTHTGQYVSHYLLKLSLNELESFSSMLVVSGDGLLHETINALMNRPDWARAIRVPIGLVPAGSGNGLAYSLLRHSSFDYDNRNAVMICCKQGIQKETCKADLVKITYDDGAGIQKTVWSFLSLGWGLLAEVDVDSEWLRCLGEWRFTIYGFLRSLTSASAQARLSFKKLDIRQQTRSYDFPIATDYPSGHKRARIESTSKNKQVYTEGHEISDNDWTHIEGEFACVYAVYQSHISRCARFSPKSKLADGIIYLTYIHGRLSACEAIKFLMSTEDGSHEQLPFVHVVPTQHFIFEPQKESLVVVDGEKIDWNIRQGPLDVKIAPRLLTLSWSSHLDKLD